MKPHVRFFSRFTPPHGSTFAALMSVLLGAAGCASKLADLGTLYQRLGGAAGVAAFADDVVRQIEQDPRIKASFAKTDIPRFKQALAGQLCEGGGGPCTDQGAAMQAALADLTLSNEQFDAFVGDLAKTMDRHGVGPSPQRTLLFPIKAMRGDVLVGVKGS